MPIERAFMIPQHRTLAIAFTTLAALLAPACGNSDSNGGTGQPSGGGGSGAASGGGGANAGTAGTDGGGSGSSGNGAFDVDDFVARIAKVRCDNLLRCYPNAGWVWEYECRAWMPARLKARTYDALPPLIDAGGVVYRPELVDACLGELASQECRDVNAVSPESCDRVFEGTSDGACTVTLECAAGSYCCEDECLPLVGKDDGTCFLDEQCEDGLRCFRGKCDEPAGLDEPCDELRCAYGSVCDGRSDECKPLADIYSVFPMPDPAPLGAPCESNTRVERCPDWAYCGSFSSLIFLDTCTGASVCPSRFDLEQICQERTQPGGACFNNADCAPLSGCWTRTCVALKTTGEECSDSTECLSEFCTESRCSPIPRPTTCPRNL